MTGRVEIEKIYPLSPMQENILFNSLFDSESDPYFEQSILPISGEIDVKLLEESLNRIIERHEILRSAVVYEKIKKPRLVIRKNVTLKIQFEDLSQLENQAAHLYYKKFLDDDKKKKFNLSKDLLIRVSLFKTGKKNYKLIFTFHHILMDGWCIGILYKDLMSIYLMLIKGEPVKLDHPASYENYLRWLENQDKEEGLEYWTNYLDNYEHAASFSKFDKKKENNVYQLEEYRLLIDETLVSVLKKTAQENFVTMNTVFQALWGILLQRYTNHNDVVFGILISGRSPEIDGINDLVGVFINTIPLRIRATGNETFDQLIRMIQAESALSTKYEYLPLGAIQSNTSLKSRLIDHIMIFQNYPFSSPNKKKEDLDSTTGEKKGEFQIGGIKAKEKTNYDLNIFIALDNTIMLKFSYNSNLYEKDFIKRISKSFLKMVAQVVESPGIKIKEIEILPDEEKSQILENFNNTYEDYPRNKTIHEIFEEQVYKYPDSIALVFEDHYITYETLNRRANRLASFLKTKGVMTESIIGLMVNRSIEMILGILGVLKAGAAYLPIDPFYPEQRINYMLNNSGSRLLLSHKNVVAGFDSIFPGFNCEIIDLFDDTPYQDNPGAINLNHLASSNNLAYVIYTSGSTGIPKGVLVEQKGVVNLLYTMQDLYPIDPLGAYLLKTNYVFDVSVTEIFGWILGVGKLVILEPGMEMDPFYVLEVIARYGITHVNFVPSQLNMLLMDTKESIEPSLKTLKYLMAAGEAFSLGLLKKSGILPSSIRVENIYGPTEGTVYSTAYRCDPSSTLEIVPIGKPINNVTAFILDKWKRLIPTGVTGELCIGGVGVARGYLNNPELTAEKFVIVDFSNKDRLYLTGDLCRWLPDGNIEFLGRFDHQVKIRGYRIELGEIENRLTNHPSVKDAILITKEDEIGDKSIWAYVVADQNISIPILRSYLAEQVPGYMIPAHFIFLDSLPLNPSGKVDRRALPNPEITISDECRAPSNEIEKVLVEIWAALLNKKREVISVDANFFELGGHSLKNTTMISNIYKRLQVKVPFTIIFESPTIRKLAQYIISAKREIYEMIQPVEEREYYLASPAQKRLYLLQQMKWDNTNYNIPQAFIIDGDLNSAGLESIFNAMLERHESLRTSFHLLDKQVIQRVHQGVKFNLEYVEPLTMEQGTGQPRILQSTLLQEFIRPFDLSRPPLIRVRILKVDDKKYFFMLDMHHVITDGMSMEVFIKDFFALYRGNTLPALRIQYKDFSQWQNKIFERGDVENQEKYWLNEFSGEIPVLNLPTDFPIPSTFNYEGDSVQFELNNALTESLKKIALNGNSTLYMVLLAIFKVFLYKLSGQSDIIVGSPVAGRSHPDLDQVIGFFINLLALRSFPSDGLTFKEFLSQVQKKTLMAFENQDYPFDDLVEKVVQRRVPGRNPLFDVLFFWQNFIQSSKGEWKNEKSSESRKEIGDTESLFNITPFAHQYNSNKYILMLGGWELQENFVLVFEFNNKVFKREHILQLAGDFIHLIESIVNNENILIGKVWLESRPQLDANPFSEMEFNL